MHFVIEFFLPRLIDSCANLVIIALVLSLGARRTTHTSNARAGQ